MGSVVVPANYLGQMIEDTEIKRACRACNPEIHFDMGVCLNIWHPRQDELQGVFWKGRHIASMDRGNVPEWPLWTVSRGMKLVDDSEVRLGDDMVLKETIFVDGKPVLTGKSWVIRAEKDKILFVGWRHTLRKLIEANVPGVTREKLAEELRITFDGIQMLPENEEQGVEVAEG